MRQREVRAMARELGHQLRGKSRLTPAHCAPAPRLECERRRATPLLGLGAIRNLFQLMGGDTAYWYRRGRGCLRARAASFDCTRV
jgi:hypothetical protein